MSEGTRWTQSITGLSSTAGFPIWFADPVQNPFAVGIGVTALTTSVSVPSYNIEVAFGYTGSSVYISSNDTWYPISGLASASSNATGNIAFPVTAIRINSLTGSSVQVITATVIQAGV